MKVNKKMKLEKDNKLVLFLTFVFILMIVLMPLLNKGTQSTDVMGEDNLTLACPDSALSDEEVECNISLNSSSIVTQGLTIKYNLSVGVEYVEFNTDTFEIYSNDENGIVLVNLDGVSGENVSVGNLKLKMSTDALPNAIYKIELVDSTIGDGEDTVVELDDVYDEIRIKSDINTLDSITLSSGELNEIFDSGILEYTVTTDVDKITISAVKTDEYSTISGDIDIEHELHYGTNEFNIVVTSEEGIEKIYKVNVFRIFEFSTDKYVYNKDDNYIYVGTDIDNMLNNIDVDSVLTMNVEDNTLVISYVDEILLEIDVLSIDLGNYVYDDVNLYVKQELDIDEFVDNIDYSDGIIFEMGTGSSISVLYDDVEIDSYDIKVYGINFDSGLVIDEENAYIKQLDLGMTVSEILGMQTSFVNIMAESYIYDKNNISKESSETISTGDKFVVKYGDVLLDEYTLSVIGDSNGDGKLGLVDLARLRKHLVELSDGVSFKLEGVYEAALDLDKNGRITVTDLARIRKKIVEAE